jgi:thiamine pyrophosphokinase
MTRRRDVVVFAGGDPIEAGLVDRIPRDVPVVAADSGLHHALDLGLHVDVVVGDFDSVDEARLALAIERGATVERHPPDKDATDLELALHAACRLGATDVLVVGAGGGRLDHFLANVLLLAAEEFSGVCIAALAGPARFTVVRGDTELRGERGSLLTLLALGGAAHGVRTKGLRYPLAGETLHPGSTRGVSNELTDRVATVEVDDGVLLAIQPTGGAR